MHVTIELNCLGNRGRERISNAQLVLGNLYNNRRAAKINDEKDGRKRTQVEEEQLDGLAAAETILCAVSAALKTGGGK